MTVSSTTSSRSVICNVCFEEFSLSALSTMECGHCFYNDSRRALERSSSHRRGPSGISSATCFAASSNSRVRTVYLIVVVEFARHAMHLSYANNTDFDPNAKTPCVIFMPEVDKING